MHFSNKSIRQSNFKIEQNNLTLFLASKKLFFLLFIVASTLIVSSCGNSDDSPEQDKLIGKWKLIQQFENNVEVILDDCEDLQGIIEFKLDGAFTDEEFKKVSGNCVLDKIDNGNWINISNNSYSLASSGLTLTFQIVFANDTFTATIQNGNDLLKTVYKRQ